MLSVIDATGKGVNQLGNFDECLALTAPTTSPKQGLCMPSSCNESNVGSNLPEYVSLFLLPSNDTSVKCYDSTHRTYKPMTTGAIVMACICSFIALIVLLSTAFEYTLIRGIAAPKRDDEFASLLGGIAPPKPLYSPKIRALIAFSLISNYNSFVGGVSDKKHFLALDGIRTLSTCWVVLGHSLLFVMMLGYDNIGYTFTTVRTFFSFQSIPAGEFAVDVFFLLSGFLVAHSLLSALDRLEQTGQSGVVFAVKYIVHRIIRLSPLYVFVLFFFWKLSPMLGTGPLWYLYEAMTSTCDKYWWTNILYINNLYPATLDNECMSWGWYMANDFQFYLIAPFVVVAFRSKKLAGYVFVALLVALTFTTNIWLSLKFNIGTFFDLSIVATTFATDIYQKPWCRIGPYAVGMGLAFVYTHERVRHYYSYFSMRIQMYVLAFGITFVLTYIPYTDFHGTPWTKGQNAVWNGLAHTMFTVGVSFFMLATFYGHGGMLKWVLERPIWRYTSKLTYSTYLIHPVILWTRIFCNTTLFHYSTVEFAYLYIGNLVFSFSSAFVLHLFIEKPFTNLERLIFANLGSTGNENLKKPISRVGRAAHCSNYTNVIITTIYNYSAYTYNNYNYTYNYYNYNHETKGKYFVSDVRVLENWAISLAMDGSIVTKTSFYRAFYNYHIKLAHAAATAAAANGDHTTTTKGNEIAQVWPMDSERIVFCQEVLEQSLGMAFANAEQPKTKTILKVLFPSYNDSSLRSMSTLFVYFQLTGNELRDKLRTFILDAPPLYTESVMHSIIGSYLLLGRGDLATSWFCHSIYVMRIAPTTSLINMMCRYYRMNNQMEESNYWVNFREATTGPTLAGNKILMGYIDPLKKPNEEALARMADRKVQVYLKPADLPQSIEIMAPSQPIVSYIDKMAKFTRHLVYSQVPTYAKVLGFDFNDLLNSDTKSIESTISIVINFNRCLFYLSRSNAFINRVLAGLYRDRSKPVELANRLLAACLKSNVPVNIKRQIHSISSNSIDPTSFVETLAKYGNETSLADQNQLIPVYMALVQGDLAKAQDLYKEAGPQESNGSMRAIVCAMLWAKSTPVDQQTLTGFESAIGLSNAEQPFRFNQLLTYVSAIEALGTLGNIPAQYIEALRTGQSSRAIINFALVYRLVTSFSDAKDSVSAFKLLHSKITVSHLKSDLYETLKAESLKDPELAVILEKFSIAADPYPINPQSINYVDNLIKSVENQSYDTINTVAPQSNTTTTNTTTTTTTKPTVQ
eukprot:gene7426-8687_t